MKKSIPFFFGLFCLLLIQACGSEGSSNDTPIENETESSENTSSAEMPDNKTEETPVYTEPAPFVAKDMLYTWVDKLNIRQSPNLKAKVETMVGSDEAVEVIGEKSKEKSIYVLRGVAYEDHWYKVKTKDGAEGWVFGGAVKRKNEKKGNPILTDEKFDFPYFGSFDLSGWKKQGSKDESGGDAEINMGTYTKGNQILEISKYETGEYGYGRTYKLMDSNKKMLKERELSFMADLDPKELVETVKDYTSKPHKKHERKQELKKHFMQLNAYPEMAFGSWTTSRIEANAEEVAALYRDIEKGGNVKLKEMIYYLDRPLNINKKDGLTLDGNRCILIMKDPNANVISIAGSSNITISDISATHVEPEGPLGCTGNVIHLIDNTDVTIEHSKLNGSGIIGVVAYGTKNLQVKNNYIFNNSMYGVLFDTETSINIEGNTFENNGPGGKDHVAKGLDGGLQKIEMINADKNEGDLKMKYNNFKE